MHDAVRDWALAHIPSSPLVVVECGGLDVNGGVRGLIEHVSWTSVDLKDGPDVDVVMDFVDYVPEVTPNLVLSLEVFEHCQHWAHLVEQSSKILAPSGFFVMTAAGPGRCPHGAYGAGLPEGEYYENIDPQELEAVLSKHFLFWSVDVQGLDVRAFAVKCG